jgi:hypothetical protein
MKKVILLLGIGVLFSISLLYAQVDRGDFFFGGSSALNISYTGTKTVTDISTDEETDNYFGLNFEPKVGSGLFTKGLVFGGLFDLSFSTYKYESGSTLKYNSYGVGPFARYYFNVLKVKPFLEVEPTIGFRNTSIEYNYEDSTEYFNPNTENHYFYYQLQGAGGVAFFITPDVSIDLLLGYYWRRSDLADSDINEREINHGFLTQIGFSIVLE